MRDLLERVKAATGPDRELDALIAPLAGLNMTWCDFDAGNYHGDCNSPGCGKPLGLSDERQSYPTDWRDDARLPHFTASLDDALALVERVLPGCRIGLVQQPDGSWGAMTFVPACIDEHYAPKASLALLAALLTAKINQTEEGDGE